MQNWGYSVAYMVFLYSTSAPYPPDNLEAGFLIRGSLQPIQKLTPSPEGINLPTPNIMNTPASVQWYHIGGICVQRVLRGVSGQKMRNLNPTFSFRV